MKNQTVRAIGLSTVVLATASLVLAPLNALARMQTESGRSDLDSGYAAWWAEPALRALGPRILDFASPDVVYLTYGKFYAIAMVAVLACAVAARSLRPSPTGWAERWGWRLTLTGFGLTLVGHLAFYWVLGTWWQVTGRGESLGDWAYGVVLLGLLVGIPGGILLGVGLLRGGFRPQFAAWVILLDLPLSLALVQVSTMALSMWPMMLAWGVIGQSLRSVGTEPTDPTGAATGTAVARV